MGASLLVVEDLVTELRTPYGVIRACDGVSFTVDRGSVLALVGESGAGKSMVGLSILGLLPRKTGRVVSGSIRLEGRELARLRGRAMERVRGRDVGIVFQDPMSSLNPVMTVGAQVAEAIRAHQSDVSPSDSRKRAVELLDLVGIPLPGIRAKQYPHEFSGGMRQRVMIAIAIANRPRLLIVDEPTTALDVTIQAQILSVLADIRREVNAAMILITHDFGVVAELADYVVVLYAGRVVERGDARAVFHRPRHPYTAGLLASLPRADREIRLSVIPGNPPSGLRVPAGCAFHPRCGLRRSRQICVDRKPALIPAEPDHYAACHFSKELDSMLSIR